MNDDIVKAIDEEIARLRQARALLLESSATPVGKTDAAASSAITAGTTPQRKPRAKARKAIAEAQRKRWAKVKTQKKASTPAAISNKEPAAS